MRIFINVWEFRFCLAIYDWRYEMAMRDYFHFDIGFGLKKWEVAVSRSKMNYYKGKRELLIIVKLPPFCDFNNTMLRKAIKCPDGICRAVNVFTGHILGYKLQKE